MVDTINVPYFEQLLDIRSFLKKKLPYFPRTCCQSSSRFVRLCVGLEEVAGEYLPTGHWHAWNYDPKRNLWVDLTLDQFSKRNPPVYLQKVDLSKDLVVMPERVIRQKERTNFRGIHDMNTLMSEYLK